MDIVVFKLLVIISYTYCRLLRLLNTTIIQVFLINLLLYNMLTHFNQNNEPAVLL